MKKDKIEDVLSSFDLDIDNNYNIFVITHPVPQITYTNNNLQIALECSMEMILEQYKISYSNDEIQKYAQIMLKSLVKLEHNTNSISAMLMDNIDINVKDEVHNANCLLSGNNNVSGLVDAITIFHQLDFNISGTIMNTLLGLRIFLLAHYSVILNKKIEIKTQYERFDLIADIDMEKIDDEKYVFSPKMIKLQEK